MAVFTRCLAWNYGLNTRHLQTPHFPPCFAQYLQFLQALHGSLPVHVAKKASVEIIVTTAKTTTSGQTRKSRCNFMSPVLMRKIVHQVRDL